MCGFTDQFAAQAMINRLAIKYQVPSLCAQVHMAGMAAEVTFTHPQRTKACHRCMLASRYRAYEEQDFENTVTSDATPVFATERLNSIKGMVAMALLHAGVEHPRWSAIMDEIADRNLVLIRMAPASANSAEMSVFSRVFAEADQSRLAFDETIWLPQEPETGEGIHPRCIDCQQQSE